MIRVRFAPSPTGKLHAGNARIALMNYLFARKNGGEFMLRMDDTDIERSRAEYVEAIKADMAWLGIEIDVYEAQSNRFDRYAELQAKLLKDGRLYPCYETPEELELKRKILLGQNKPPLYDRGALALSDAEKAEFAAQGRKPHYRFKLNDTPMQWQDMAKGAQNFTTAHLSDPVLIRNDGTFLFTFTTVVDDIDFAISHIIRGDDHISNTALQVQIFEAMGATKLPEFAHLPLISNHEGKNFSKRDDDISLENLREQQKIEPMALIASLLRIGTSTAADGMETMQSLQDEFDVTGYGKAAPRFIMGDLYELNSKILQHIDYDAVKERLTALHPQADANFWQIMRQNISKFHQLEQWAMICFGDITPPIADEDQAMLAQARDLLPQDLTADNCAAWVKQVGEATGRKGKGLFMPLRLALTGQSHGPEIKEILPLIGYKRACERLGG